MDRPEQLTRCRVELARIFSTIDAAEDYLVAGDAEIELVGLLDVEARAADAAEATSDPDGPLPPQVTVSRGRSPRTEQN